MKPRKKKNRRLKRRDQYLAAKPTPTHFVRLRLPRVDIATGRRWFVVRTVPNADARVERGLKALGVETYVPTLVEERTRRGRKVEVAQHPAAGYVFAGTTLGAEAASVLGHVDGALEVLSADGGPSEVKPEALQLFADILTRCNEEAREAFSNEEAREASSTVGKPKRLKGLAELRELVLVPEA